MGFFDRIKNAVNPQEGDDYGNEGYDTFDGDDDGYFGDPAPAQNNQQNSGNYGYSAPQQSQPKAQSTSGMGFSSGALELKVVKPEKYDSTTAQKIADHLLNRRTVVLNLESTNKESARRLIDFLSGVAYSIDGYIQRVANNTFVIVPNNVDVSGEQLQEAKKQEDTDLF